MNDIDIRRMEPIVRFRWKNQLTSEQKTEVVNALHHHERMCERSGCPADPRFLAEAVDEVVNGRSVWT